MSPRTRTVKNGVEVDGRDEMDKWFDDVKALLEARRAEHVAAAERIGDVLTSMQPKPRIGRPPRKP